MQMEEVRELREALERVEGKLIAAEKVYAAMNFALWLSVMSIFYVIAGIGRVQGWLSPVYWGAAILIGVLLTIKMWNQLKKLYSTFYPEIAKRDSKKMILLIGLSWAAGSIIGWDVVPSIDWVGINADARLGVGFLSFIGLSLLGQWIAMSRGKGEYEMTPSFLFPFLAIPIAWNMGTGAILWAGFAVTAGFSLTILLYLYSAFKVIER
ncbi:hypothetical protein [Thermococcus sp.]|uniref:hypothetical protein n=1 Tax=Thermococcus sp. TaxID=35749 RepID=UPI00262BE62F|nr:hypothetical protein [Thermococcus sp.]